MPKRSRRKASRNSRRTTWIALGLLVLIAVSGIGVYVYTRPPSSASSNTSSGTTNTTSRNLDKYAVLDTSQGTIVVELFPQDAPKTVLNFETLANSSFYNDLVWHRIVNGFVIQTGDPNTKNGGGDESTWGQGGSGTTIPFENSGLPEGQGCLAMANTSPKGSGASSQFFINLVNNTSSLDDNYAVFGQVVSGIQVVQAIGSLPVNSACQSSGGLTCQPVTPSNAMLISVIIQSTA